MIRSAPRPSSRDAAKAPRFIRRREPSFFIASIAHCRNKNETLPISRPSAGLHDARVDELLDLRHDHGVLLVLRRGFRVRAHVVQHLAHHRVAQDVLDLGVLHRALLPLLHLRLVHLPGLTLLDLDHRPPQTILELLVRRVLRQTELVRLQRFVVLLREELDVALSRVPFREVRLESDALLRVFQSFVERRQLGVARRAVRVHAVILRVARDRLRVPLDRLGVLLLLKKLVALLASDLSLRGV
mmetsp:Transcript_14710/g.63130  ORF Transcript_14710/g.63130 Transcript_14710/m.63130 type:complete len:243 (-) Transcript_14710:1146-1874(-)